MDELDLGSLADFTPANADQLQERDCSCAGSDDNPH